MKGSLFSGSDLHRLTDISRQQRWQEGTLTAGDRGGGALPGPRTPEASRLRRRTRGTTPSRHYKIRGIQKKRYNNEILKPDTGSVWFFHVDDQNPG